VKLPAFDYAAPATLREALDLLAANPGAKALAGGQSLIPTMAFRLAAPPMLVDLANLRELEKITIDANGAHLGARVRWRDIEDHAALAKAQPLLADAISHVAHYQVRNRGTIGGSLAHADPCAELPLAAQVLDARMVLRASKGKRTLDAASFFTGAMSTAIRADECLEEIEWPVWREPRTGSAFTELCIRHGDFAVVAAAAQVALDEAGRCVRAAFGLAAVGQTPLAFPKLAAGLVGNSLTEDLLRAAANDAADACEPGSDLHASAEYRRHLAAVLAARALHAAHEKAQAA
jgi:CO/xanthine dehydrogenase FAD-binding subunit